MKDRSRLQLALLVLLPVCLGLFYFFSHPFKETLAARSIDLSRYSPNQRLNFVTAARCLNGAVIKPHETFSFNGRVGPRQSEKGFMTAPSYLAGQRVDSIGGGICLVSSTLYQVALLSGLEIVERTPHSDTVASVAPGLDATVWYGRADLKIRNPYDAPVALACHVDGDSLNIAVTGDALTKLGLKGDEHSFRRRQIEEGDRQSMLVEVYLKDGLKEHLVSRDRYRLHR
ncbi:MAG: VanW family protein [Cyanobacteria bacterium REEB67]|nr:VanW family protein [Cyanobacteria bacterium REEB67]